MQRVTVTPTTSSSSACLPGLLLKSALAQVSMQSSLKWWARVKSDVGHGDGLDSMMVRRRAALARLGLPWPPPRAKPGRPNRQTRYIDELYGHARRGEIDVLDLVENTDPPVWWQPGLPAGMGSEIAERRAAQVLAMPRAASDDDTEEAPEVPQEEGAKRKRRKKVHINPVAISWFLDFKAHMKKTRSWTTTECWDFAVKICPEVYGTVHPKSHFKWHADVGTMQVGRPRNLSEFVRQELCVLMHSMSRGSQCSSCTVASHKIQ